MYMCRRTNKSNYVNVFVMFSNPFNVYFYHYLEVMLSIHSFSVTANVSKRFVEVLMIINPISKQCVHG